MIKQSDYVVTYVTNDIASGAAKYKKLAEKDTKLIGYLIFMLQNLPGFAII